MPLLKLLHFAALLCWSGALLYLPALIAGGAKRSGDIFERNHAQLTRMVFTLIATPAALLAIGSGTALFLRDGIIEGWLVMKLTAVAGMALCHAFCGALLVRMESQPERGVTLPCILVGALIPLLISATLWLVLAKPF
ncbi:hypothetical protein DN824_11690 [Stutzerimonas nosocomialis]|uniref:Protoporphyrinogen IX oxidase n=1 Tax=Stutzerimonas nosocomialis TaxID=1056496 RepID=A0A5R9QIB1_9GAMM|nr:CopD family protein [Stutzerimonas nosocomialis]TLX57213.1 hypothetical protein DN824_11690 [Stutzerimonas nosocomialis]TLX59264.1 hypothetical protein DN826_00250 [Stutzerimonas nosocomialis]TLX64662.1 hypothetical protein DN820_04360 [Stutzerimonas nosocomialis]